MTLAELITLFRSRAADEAAPYLWSDTEVTGYANEAQREACIRARLLRDASSAIRRLSVTAPTEAAEDIATAVAALIVLVDAATAAATTSTDAPTIAAMVTVDAAADALLLAADAAVADTTGATVDAVAEAVTTLNVAILTADAAAAASLDAPTIAAVAAVEAAGTALDTQANAAQAQVVGDIGISPLVLDVLKARLDGETRPLDVTSVDWMHDGWETASRGSPTHLLLEREARGYRAVLWPVPTESVTVLLTVTRLPLVDMDADDDEPEIPLQYHERLVDWMLRCAYLKRDAEVFDPKGAADAESRFVVSFGIFQDANVYRKHADKARNVVQFQGF